mgnify:FL=1
MKNDALDIISCAVKAADPYDSTRNILNSLKDELMQSLTVFSIGKAAVPMADAAQSVFGERIKNGLLVTKYSHIGSFFSKYFDMVEAAHPISDNNSILAAEKALMIAENLGEGDALLVLLSGGGSALLEKSVVSAEIQRDITKKLLARGAEIDEINAIRRRISLVKGGKLAAAAYPAKVYTVALSDVLSNDKSVIASGITVKESLPKDEFLKIANKYLPEYIEIFKTTVSDEEIKINDGGYFFAGDINSLCSAAEKRAKELGYNVADSFRTLTGEASDNAARLIAKALKPSGKNAYVYGGETTVTLKGNGLGGRNQEMALRAAIELKGKDNIVFASVGSDGTDGPTDAAGGIADGNTYRKMKEKGIDPEAELKNNNSYYALGAADALIVTGPTGTNVNDLTLILTEK